MILWLSAPLPQQEQALLEDSEPPVTRHELKPSAIALKNDLKLERIQMQMKAEHTQRNLGDTQKLGLNQVPRFKYMKLNLSREKHGFLILHLLDLS